MIMMKKSRKKKKNKLKQKIGYKCKQRRYVFQWNWNEIF